ncbi:hypothetical protein [Paenibacillus sp. sgz302251]|uniref:hypothetical protein n=1 Tax=Paenibacillus sp. sgz302251 TaxID=3414493 RepID=UPI003C7E9895
MRTRLSYYHGFILFTVAFVTFAVLTPGFTSQNASADANYPSFTRNDESSFLNSTRQSGGSNPFSANDVASLQQIFRLLSERLYTVPSEFDNSIAVRLLHLKLDPIKFTSEFVARSSIYFNQLYWK